MTKDSGCRYVKHTTCKQCARLKGIYKYRLKLSNISVYNDAFYYSSCAALLHASLYEVVFDPHMDKAPVVGCMIFTV